MLSLENRLNLLKEDLLREPPSFVMTRELPFAIFRYDPRTTEESEWIVASELTRPRGKSKVQNWANPNSCPISA